MNNFQSTGTGSGLLKDYYDESSNDSISKALEKRRKKRRLQGMDSQELSDEDKLLGDVQQKR